MILKVGVHRFDAACFAVAGVVTNNVCQLTNIGWTVDLSLIKSQFHISKLRIINDFEAVGHGISELKEKDLLTLNPGVAQSMGPIAVLGPGTGLGEAILFGVSTQRVTQFYPQKVPTLTLHQEVRLSVIYLHG